MVKENQQPGWKTTAGRTLAWILACVFILIDIFFVRDALSSYLSWYGIQQLNALTEKSEGAVTNISNSLAAIDRWALLLLGVIGVSAAVLTDHYLRSGETEGQLGRRTAIVFGVLVGVAALSIIIQQAI